MSDKPKKRGNTEALLKYKKRLGIIMFLIYLVTYIGFVSLSVYKVSLMDTVMPFNLNLAVFYGLGLIFFAILLAVIFSIMCNLKERSYLTKNNSTKDIPNEKRSR